MAAPLAIKKEEEDWAQVEAEDARNLAEFLAGARENGEPALDMSRPLEPGEKADDAQDFEDISDDDLADDLDANAESSGGVPGLTDDAGSHDTDDLFGDDPFDDLDHMQGGVEIESDTQLFGTQRSSGGLTLPSLHQTQTSRDVNFDPKPDHSAIQDLAIPAPAESLEEVVQLSWPKFKKGAVLDWTDLLPPKKAHFLPKTPLKTPRPVVPTKVNLELAPDSEKNFRLAGPANIDKTSWEADAESRGIIAILDESADEKSSDEGLDWDIPLEDEIVGGVSWADLEVLCDDWDSKIDPGLSDSEATAAPQEDPDDDEDWLGEIRPAAKRQKTSHVGIDLFNSPIFEAPSFDDFERATERIGKRVTIDLNDPYILIDYIEHIPAKRQRTGLEHKRGVTGSMAKTLHQRFNISNDEAYDALKENHQSKVRATIGNISVEHSMPALKLQWPYYRVKLYTHEARAPHRPSLKFGKFVNSVIQFSKPNHRKRKHMKNMSSQEIFKESKDLSLADNSNAMLVEYSEEHPTVLSNFGMGNRIINYYRRRNAEDTTRPKHDVGETHVLLPEDKSPFQLFGSVDPGETVPTLHNAMYRAPVFKHDPKKTDFLAIRSSTGIGGTSWYLRNVDNLYVVGQQFPSVVVPGPHSRAVTTAAKNRMKMIAYRRLRKSPHRHMKIGDITAHISESTDMQNRQKLKEFMQYSKEEKVWKMRAGEQVPEEVAIRAMIKPEDVCLIDGMQVGLRYLEDAGYGKEDDEDLGDNEDAPDGQSLEQQLAPWATTKNFLNAAADKAMLELHGEGDPSGCGLAFSFIKTSMKGGFLEGKSGPSATSADAIAREKKANGGHKYNVAKQDALYKETIRDIWEKQKANLADEVEHSENELEREQDERDEGIAPTPRSVATPANFDDSASQISRFSNSSRRGRVMRITRMVKTKFEAEEVTEVVKNPQVWREYMKRRHAIDAENKKYPKSCAFKMYGADLWLVFTISRLLATPNRTRRR